MAKSIPHRHILGQAAMEFLMTYGWALLVVLIVIAALALFGMLNPGKYLPAKCEISPGLNCLTSAAVTDNPDISDGLGNDNITLVVQNGIGYSMYNVTVNGTKCLNADAYANVTVVTEGESVKFTFPCRGMTPNSRYRTDLMVKYTEVAQGEAVGHAAKGSLFVDVGRT